MFNPDKVFTLITHINSVLEKQDKYTLYCQLEESEAVELGKHFIATEVVNFDNNEKKIVFTKK